MAALITATAPKARRKLQLPALAAVLVLLVVAAIAKYAVMDGSVLLSLMSLGAQYFTA